ncbi:APS reductase 3 [Artemisia annua]|uniref:APS reductase 3 n=1 Tax=Artemisia annua TaxID=35608 RepID=A0A2U1QLW1_ARTAN|nr:APS reductase 3 [Artemisia annua]
MKNVHNTIPSLSLYKDEGVAGVQLSASNLQFSDGCFPAPVSLSLSRKRSQAVKALNAEPKRNDSIVPSAATVSAPGVFWSLLELNACWVAKQLYMHDGDQILRLLRQEFAAQKLPDIPVSQDSSRAVESRTHLRTESVDSLLAFIERLR